jgi:hypothetical protein
LRLPKLRLPAFRAELRLGMALLALYGASAASGIAGVRLMLGDGPALLALSAALGLAAWVLARGAR